MRDDSGVLGGRGVHPMQVLKARTARKRQFAVLSWRWIAERTFGWLFKCRLPATDYASRTGKSESIIWIAATRLMLARLP